MIKNEFFYNDNILKEYIIKVTYKNTLIYGNLFSLLGFILTIYHISKNNMFQIGIYSISLIILLLVTYISPFLYYKQIKKQGKKLHNNNKYKTITTFDDKIYVNEGSFSISFDYNQITKLHKLKNCYVLMVYKTPIIIEQNSFTKGTVEDFLSLIKEKCINLKL